MLTDTPVSVEAAEKLTGNPAIIQILVHRAREVYEVCALAQQAPAMCV